AGDLAAGQQVQRPGRIARWRLAEIAHQRRALVERGGAAVEFAVEGGEAAHVRSDRPLRARALRLPPLAEEAVHASRQEGGTSARSILLSIPGAERARIDPVLAQLAHDGVGVAVRRNHAAGAGLTHGTDQVGPVGVVGDDEAAVVVATAAVAADTHPAGGKAGLRAPEAAHPRTAR